MFWYFCLNIIRILFRYRKIILSIFLLSSFNEIISLCTHRFILDLSELYYWKFFIQPFLLTYAMPLAVFFYKFVSNRNFFCNNAKFIFRCQIKELLFVEQTDWVAGLGSAFLCYAQLIILCDIGNSVVSSVIFSE